MQDLRILGWDAVVLDCLRKEFYVTCIPLLAPMRANIFSGMLCTRLSECTRLLQIIQWEMHCMFFCNYIFKYPTKIGIVVVNLYLADLILLVVKIEFSSGYCKWQINSTLFLTRKEKRINGIYLENLSLNSIKQALYFSQW